MKLKNIFKLSKYKEKTNQKLKRFMRNTARIWPDKLYVSILYRLYVGQRLHWKNPKRFTEKLQWLKVNYRNDAYTNLVDKCDVKKKFTT